MRNLNKRLIDLNHYRKCSERRISYLEKELAFEVEKLRGISKELAVNKSDSNAKCILLNYLFYCSACYRQYSR